MAEDIVTPGSPPANIPLRQTLSWTSALDIYRAAAARSDDYRAAQLRPAYTNSKLSFRKVSAIETEADRLWEVQLDRLCDLVAVPAPDWRALCAKLEYAYRDYLIFELSSREVIDKLLADMRRLDPLYASVLPADPS
jgi:hypothetical protein